jgi:hypothetical protein
MRYLKYNHVTCRFTASEGSIVVVVIVVVVVDSFITVMCYFPKHNGLFLHTFALILKVFTYHLQYNSYNFFWQQMGLREDYCEIDLWVGVEVVFKKRIHATIDKLVGQDWVGGVREGGGGDGRMVVIKRVHGVWVRERGGEGSRDCGILSSTLLQI